MVYKTIANSLKAHNVYPITQTIIVPNLNILHKNPSNLLLIGINRIIKNNNIIILNNNDFIITYEGNKYSKLLFDDDLNLKIDIINKVTYINNIKSLLYIKLLKISNSNSYTIKDNIIINNNKQVIAQYIPLLSIILWKTWSTATNKDITIEYKFNIHLYLYMCSIAPSLMNRTNNLTAYDENLKLKDNVTDLYMTTIGLYSDDGVLLAIAKLSEPIRISKKIHTNIVVQFDYVI